MRSPACAPFVAILQTEVMLNSKRVAPYAMLILFSANAWLWTAKGAAVYYGWATNGDYFIARSFIGFSFMTLPLFTALIMGDPVIRDFRSGVAPLIFSKPVSRAAYILGKFSGNFFVLVCCQMGFLLTMIALQWLRTSEMVVVPARVAPFIKHFFVLVVISQMAMAAAYFMLGTLTRNPKIAYAAAALFYPLYAAYQVLILRGLPERWRIALDPLLMNWANIPRGRDGSLLNAEAVNQLALSYGSDIAANRALMITIAAAFLAILYARFSTVEQPAKARRDGLITIIDLETRSERLYQENVASARPAQVEAVTPAKAVALPKVSAVTEGARARLKQLAAALGVELRLLFAERSVVALLPLAAMVSLLGLAYYEAAADPSYSAAYAWQAADSFLLFLIAIAVFFTGEAMHRDRELKVEPVLWSAPVTNSVLLLSKFTATLLFSAIAGALVCMAAIALQAYKGHGPVELSAYLIAYCVILIPSMVFMAAAATALNVLLRDKHLAYAAGISMAGGSFYLFNMGYNHPLYNPALYGLWTPADLMSGVGGMPQVLAHRIYSVALGVVCLSLAHLFFERKSTAGPYESPHLSGRRWAILIMLLAIAAAVIMVMIEWM